MTGAPWSTPRRVARWVITSAIYGGMLFTLAGRTDLPFLWAFWAAGAAVGLVLLLAIDADLLRERQRPASGGIDRWRRVPFGILFFTQLIVATLDVGRAHWSDTVPVGVRVASLAAYVAGVGVLTWSLAVNRFFSPVVRIQSERGHTLVTAGPYGVVRHPGYIAMSVMYLATGPAIGSWWAAVPGFVGVILLVQRAALEDRYLRANLDGYAAYAGTVRYRLVPGVW